MDREEFEGIVQEIINDNDIAQVDWMGDDGGQGSILVYKNPQPQGNKDLIIVQEDEEITCFPSVASVYQDGLEGLGCFPVGVIALGSNEDNVDIEANDEYLDDEFGTSEDDLTEIDLIQWDCTECSGTFFVDSNQDKLARCCPFCQSPKIEPLRETD